MGHQFKRKKHNKFSSALENYLLLVTPFSHMNIFFSSFVENQFISLYFSISNFLLIIIINDLIYLTLKNTLAEIVYQHFISNKFIFIISFSFSKFKRNNKYFIFLSIFWTPWTILKNYYGILNFFVLKNTIFYPQFEYYFTIKKFLRRKFVHCLKGFDWL